MTIPTTLRPTLSSEKPIAVSCKAPASGPGIRRRCSGVVSPILRPPAYQLLYRLRTAEAVTAYKHALAVNPDLEEAHVDLISLYQDMNYQDEVLAELKEVLRCNRKAGRLAGENQKDYAARIVYLEDLTAQKEKDVAALLDKFEVKSAGMPIFNKAEAAWADYGLAGKSLSLLLGSDVASFGREGMGLELELLLHTGRVKDVREWPDPEAAKDYLGAAQYREMQLQLDAASGDYQKADDDLEEMIGDIYEVKGPSGARPLIRAGVAVAAARAVLLAAPREDYVHFLTDAGHYCPSILENAVRLTDSMREEANLTTLRGLLALECGAVDQSRKDFQDALSLWGDAATANAGGGLNYSARPITQDCLRLLDKAAAARSA